MKIKALVLVMLISFYGRTQDSRMEISSFSVQNCKGEVCLCFEGIIREQPKKLQIYVSDRWGNPLQEFDKTEGCYFVGDKPLGVYHIIMIGKYKRKDVVQVQMTVEYSKEG